MTLTIPANVLDAARIAFEEAGAWGREATGLLSGNCDGINHVVKALTVPDQVASQAPRCSVEVTETGKLQLAAALRPDERWIARIHSHPSEAFHSPTDDANQVLTAEGSWSIVVPYFGLGLRRGISACAVLQLVRGRWGPLSQTEMRSQIHVVYA